MKEQRIIFSGLMVRPILNCKPGVWPVEPIDPSNPFKWQTRRLINRLNSLVDGRFPSTNPDHVGAWPNLDFNDAFVDPGPSPSGNPGPYLKVADPKHGTRHRVYPRLWDGDLLWVAEAYQLTAFDPDDPTQEVCGFYADRKSFRDVPLTNEEWAKLCNRRYPMRPTPGRFMYRSLSRISLSVTSSRPERVQEITEEDAIAEGTQAITLDDVRRPAAWSERQDFSRIWDFLHAKRGFGWDMNNWVWVYLFWVLKPEGGGVS